MYTVNDSMFALILRFVGRNQEITFCDQEFIQKQLKAIQTHIEKFPPEEQELRAVKWIEKYAREYRKTWEKEMIDKEFSDQRCPDCPLFEVNDFKHCQIHDQWLKLLEQYVAGEINTREYVENALNLLVRHKENLKIKLNMLKK